MKGKKLILSSTVERIKISLWYTGLYDEFTTLARVGITSHLRSMLLSPWIWGEPNT